MEKIDKKRHLAKTLTWRVVATTDTFLIAWIITGKVDFVDEKFAGMINAFKYGAPPHGGSAPGIDRIVMLLADTPNIREVTLFPMNNQAEDLMMQAPNEVSEKQLKELHIKLDLPKEIEKGEQGDANS